MESRIIQEIYRKYHVMPQLETHMLRVAAVASLICESLEVPVNKDDVITACLLHDIGNIIKFDLNYFPEFLEPRGLAYWEKVQKEYRDKYGNEHFASMQISEEIGVSKRVLDLIDAVGITKSPINAKSNDIEKMICAYSDMRVFPKGVVSLGKRLDDLTVRYNGRFDKLNDEMPLWRECLMSIEKDIFSVSKSKPEDINDESVNLRIKNLSGYNI